MAPGGGEQRPLQAPAPMTAMQGQETLQNLWEPHEVSLDMQRYYSKHQLPVLSYYGTPSVIFQLTRAGDCACPTGPRFRLQTGFANAPWPVAAGRHQTYM